MPILFVFAFALIMPLLFILPLANDYHPIITMYASVCECTAPHTDVHKPIQAYCCLVWVYLCLCYCLRRRRRFYAASLTYLFLSRYVSARIYILVWNIHIYVCGCGGMCIYVCTILTPCSLSFEAISCCCYYAILVTGVASAQRCRLQTGILFE